MKSSSQFLLPLSAADAAASTLHNFYQIASYQDRLTPGKRKNEKSDSTFFSYEVRQMMKLKFSERSTELM